MHGDVFRPPRHGMLLSVVVGSGVQVLSMMLITLGGFSRAAAGARWVGTGLEPGGYLELSDHTGWILHVEALLAC